MYGTATKVETWLVLEYNGRWSGDAFRDSKIPETAKAAINRYLEEFPNSRLQLVKKEEQGGDGIKLFIAHSREREAVNSCEITLGRYEDLLELEHRFDYQRRIVRDGESRYFSFAQTASTISAAGSSACRCIWRRQEGVNGQDTWQTTHIGGHRFASTFVCLPTAYITDASGKERERTKYSVNIRTAGSILEATGDARATAHPRRQPNIF